MLNKFDNSVTPVKEDLQNIVRVNHNYIMDFCNYIESNLSAKEQIDYSKCSAAPGWNFKYKKKGKSVCTIYPSEDFFTVLITLNFDDLEKFNVIKTDFQNATIEKITDIKPMNGTKWLMLDIKENSALSEAKRLIAMKYDL